MLLLADIFADYGKRSYEIYQLDPIYCVSSPGFSNRAMLKCTSAEIKLIIDNNMHLIIEKGSRGGRCEPLLLKAEANNKYVNKNFDKNKDTEKYLVSLDVNSLYQTAMTDKLPNGSFKYVDDISTFTTVLMKMVIITIPLLLILTTQRNYTLSIMNCYYYVIKKYRPKIL